MLPLGEGYSVLDFIVRLRCPVLVAARNKLGVINHTLLTVQTMQAVGIKSIAVVLSGCKERDTSANSNRRILMELLSPIRVFSLPFLGRKASCPEAVKNNYKKI